MLSIDHGHQVLCTAFSPDGNLLATRSADNIVRLWDAATGERRIGSFKFPDQLKAVTFSPDGKTLAAAGGSFRQGSITLWETSSGQETRTLLGHDGYVFSIAFSPDGKTLVSGSRDHTASLWDLAQGARTKTFQPGNVVGSAAFSPDGKYVAAGSADGNSRLWDVSTRELVHTLRGCQLSGVAFSADSSSVVCTGEDESLKLLDVASGELAGTSGPLRNPLRRLTSSPTGKTFAVALENNTVELWDANTWGLETILKGHAHGVTSIAFSPDGKTLATGSYDRTLKLW